MLTRRDLLKGAAAAGTWLAAPHVLHAQAPRAAASGSSGLIRFVDPFIGTGGQGGTFPGAVVPAGLVQLSPDTVGADGLRPSGYHHGDAEIAGFSHTHLSGVPDGDLCDISVMPVLAGREMPPSAASPFTHAREQASPGYYTVDLLGSEIKVELTATRRVGVHRYRFPRWIPARPPAVLFDLGFALNGDRTVDAAITIDGPTTVSGYRQSTGWAREQRVFFVARFSKPVTQWLLGAAGDYGADRRQAQGPALRALFKPVLRPGDPLIMKVALSPVSVEGALRNLDAEAPGWDFETFRRDAEEAWERKLQRVRIESQDPARKTVFYTGLYHALLSPALACDADRAYRGADGEARTAPFQNHTGFALADTYRTLHPLMTLVQAERVDYFVQSLVAFARESGRLPVWPLWGSDTNTGVGYPAAPVIVDAILKNLTTVNRGEALDALKAAAAATDRGLQWLNRADTRGFIPADKELHAVSRTLEYGFDDWCVSRLAATLERATDRRLFEARAGVYRNVFDSSTGFMRGRLADGSWRAPFPPGPGDGGRLDYAEGSAWISTWSVTHDVRGLMTLMGGPEAFVKRLDGLFSGAAGAGRAADVSDRGGLLGHYAHGMPACHHVPYLNAYAGAPWLAAARARQLAAAFYTTGPEGLCSHDRAGQLSAWYLFTALGFYPVNPVDGAYVLGSPLVDRATIDLGGGRTFTVESDALSDAHQYVKGVSLNDKPLDRCWISHAEVAAGGTLRFHMATEPNRSWASAPGAAPPSMTPLEGKPG
jgi:predicted alpha-1,2-mannosidase